MKVGTRSFVYVDAPMNRPPSGDARLRSPWDAEIELSSDLARELVARAFPGLAPVRAELLGYGWDNAAFLVNGGYVFRFPRRAVAVELIRSEGAVLPRIEPLLTAPIPVPVFAGSPSAAYPWPFAGYPLLRGTPLDAARPSSRERAQLAPALGTFLRDLHGSRVRAAVGDLLGGDTIGRLDHAKRLPQARARLHDAVAAGVLADGDIFVAAMERLAPDGAVRPAVVVHGDLYARHLLVDDGGALAGVIDWGDIHLGDPALDIAAALLVLPPGELDAFRAHYGTIDATTWDRATYRAIHHAALELAYGIDRNDRDLIDAALFALGALREQL
jgi:aminoglycoside phosphotransferase (APT) family kinase protein